MEKFKGVMKIALNVAKAVKLTDKAALALAIELMKLEMFPPGQEATKIIPNAMVGDGFTNNEAEYDSLIAALQDLLLHGVKGLSRYALAARKSNIALDEVNRFICEACFSTLTNVNFDEARFVHLIHRNQALCEALKQKIKDAGGTLIMDCFDVMDAGRMLMAADPTGAVFGVWQPGNHIGAQVVNQANSLVWNELQTNDLEAAKAFYGAVFGWTNEVDQNGYVVFSADGRGQAGMMECGEEQTCCYPHRLDDVVVFAFDQRPVVEGRDAVQIDLDLVDEQRFGNG